MVVRNYILPDEAKAMHKVMESQGDYMLQVYLETFGAGRRSWQDLRSVWLPESQLWT